MKTKIQNAIIVLLVVCLCFIGAYCDFSGLYLVMAVPFMIALFFYNNIFFLLGTIATIAAGYLINPDLLPFAGVMGVLVFYLLAFSLKPFVIQAKHRAAILGTCFTFVVSLIQQFNNPSINIVNTIIAILMAYLLCYMISDITVDLTSKDHPSLTRNEVIYFVFYINLIIYKLNFDSSTTWITLSLIVIINYLLVLINWKLVIYSLLFFMLFNLQELNLAFAIYLSGLLIFTHAKKIYQKPITLVCYVAWTITGCLILELPIYVTPILLLMTLFIFCPTKIPVILGQYVVEPSEYELKAYQRDYYYSLYKNKKIQLVIASLQEQMANKKFKDSNRKLLESNLKYLEDKLKEGDTVKLKKEIIKELTDANLDILGIKMQLEVDTDYKIFIHLNGTNDNPYKILDILERKLDVKLKIYRYHKHGLLDCMRYYICNDKGSTLEVAIKQHSKEENSCGDNYISFNTKNYKYVLISDGMGHGEKASLQSTAALFLVKNLIELKMDPSRAIMTCNALLCDKEREIFNTLDLLEYDISKDEIYLYKNGSGTTYLLDNSDMEIKKIWSENLPLGIVDEIEVKRMPLDLKTGCIVLTSDGIKVDISNALITSKGDSSLQVTNEIINTYPDEIDDDQTVVVVNVIKKY